MPATGRPAPDIRSNGDGSVTIKYVPTQSGVHELNVAYNEQPVNGIYSSFFTVIKRSRTNSLTNLTKQQTQ